MLLISEVVFIAIESSEGDVGKSVIGGGATFNSIVESVPLQSKPAKPTMIDDQRISEERILGVLTDALAKQETRINEQIRVSRTDAT